MQPNLAGRIAGEIQAELKRKRMTQKSLAAFLDLTPQRLSQLLHSPADLDLNRLEQICLAIGVTIDELAARAA